MQRAASPRGSVNPTAKLSSRPMTNRLLSVLSLVIATSSLGFALYRSEAPEKETAQKRPPPPEPEALSYDEELEGKVSALEWVVSALSRRLETVETSISRAPMAGANMPNQAAPIPGDVGQRVAALQKDVDALFAAGVFDTEHGRERAKDVFRELQGEIAMERFRAREEAREEQRKTRFSQFAQQARLTGVQQQRLEGLLDGEVTKRQALLSELQAGNRDRGEVFRELRGLREQTDSAAREILPGGEYEQYREMRRAENGRGGRGGEAQGQGRGGRAGEGARGPGAGEGQGRGPGRQQGAPREGRRGEGRER